MSTSRESLGYAAAVLAAVLWSTLGVLAKIVYGLGADPLTVISLRATLAAGIVFIVISMKGSNDLRVSHSDIPLFIVYGFFGVALNYLGYFYALKFTTVATAITLLYTYPALVVIFAFFHYGEPITHRKIVVLSLTFVGIILSSLNIGQYGFSWNVEGLAFGLLASLGNAVYTLAGKKAQRIYNTKTNLFYSFLIGSLFLLSFRLASLGTAFTPRPVTLGLIFVIALFPTVLGYGLFTLSLRFIEAGSASLVSSVEPVFAICLAFLILGEIPGLLQILGSTLIVLGVFILRFRPTTGDKTKLYLERRS